MNGIANGTFCNYVLPSHKVFIITSLTLSHLRICGPLGVGLESLPDRVVAQDVESAEGDAQRRQDLHQLATEAAARLRGATLHEDRHV